MTEILQDYLPLTETTFYILLSMAVERKHGYAILKDMETLNKGRVVPSTGTLYGALSRLLDQELIERVEEENPEEVGRPRKFYSLTQFGSKVLEAEMVRLRSLVVTTEQRITLDME